MKKLVKATYFVALVFLACSSVAYADGEVQGALDSLGIGQGNADSQTATFSSSGNNTLSPTNNSNSNANGSGNTSPRVTNTNSTSNPGNGTVTNNGSSAVVIVVNVDGKKRIEQVSPGQTYTAPSGTTKIGFFSAAEDVTVVTNTGQSRRFNDGSRPSTINMNETSTVEVNNNAGGNGGTLTMPPITSSAVNPNNQGANLGTGMSQSPTDGPVGYGGDVHGLTKEMEQEIIDKLKNANHEDEFHDIADEYDLSEDDFSRLLAAADGDRWYWYYSGSGASFGDWVAFNFAFIGWPTSGAPFGSWTQFDRRTSIFSTDRQLIEALGTDSFASLFESQYGDQGFEEDIDAGF